MKRILCFLLIIAVCAAFLGCRPQTEKIRQPVNCYYRNSEVTYGSTDSLISAQVTESAGFENVTALLNDYLRGPNSSTHDATFPASTKVLELTIHGDTAYLGMNDSLARLSGIDLTIACACITMTTAELTGVSAVTISTSNELLDGAASITMNLNDLILLDQSATVETE